MSIEIVIGLVVATILLTALSVTRVVRIVGRSQVNRAIARFERDFLSRSSPVQSTDERTVRRDD